MASPEQNAASHSRYLPLFHFVVSPILLVYMLTSLYGLFQSPSRWTLLGALSSLAIWLGISLGRTQALTAQDRIIRLEESLRLRRLLPAELHADIDKLARKEFVALRFASDAELPELFGRVRKGEFATPKEIKLAIRQWRPDNLRV